jgi:hypothetical protein
VVYSYTDENGVKKKGLSEDIPQAAFLTRQTTKL